MNEHYYAKKSFNYAVIEHRYAVIKITTKMPGDNGWVSLRVADIKAIQIENAG